MWFSVVYGHGGCYRSLVSVVWLQYHVSFLLLVYGEILTFGVFSMTDECRKVAKDGRFGQNRWKGYHEKVCLVLCECYHTEVVCVDVLRKNVGVCC